MILSKIPFDYDRERGITEARRKKIQALILYRVSINPQRRVSSAEGGVEPKRPATLR